MEEDLKAAEEEKEEEAAGKVQWEAKAGSLKKELEVAKEECEDLRRDWKTMEAEMLTVEEERDKLGKISAEREKVGHMVCCIYYEFM